MPLSPGTMSLIMQRSSSYLQDTNWRLYRKESDWLPDELFLVA